MKKVKNVLITVVVSMVMVAGLTGCFSGQPMSNTPATPSVTDEQSSPSNESEIPTETTSDTETSTEATSEIESPTTTEDANTENNDGDTYEGETFACKYISHKIVKDYDGKPALEIIFEYTNNDDNAQAFLFDAGVDAYQEGVQLDMAIVMDKNKDVTDSTTKIKKGKTITTAVYFSLSNKKTDVELEFGPLITLDDSDKTTKVLKLK